MKPSKLEVRGFWVGGTLELPRSDLFGWVTVESLANFNVGLFF